MFSHMAEAEVLDDINPSHNFRDGAQYQSGGDSSPGDGQTLALGGSLPSSV